MNKISFLLTLLAVLFLSACGGGGSSSTTKHDTVKNTGKEIGIIGEDLTTPKATLKKIKEIPEFSKVDFPWLSGNWASYAVPGLGMQDRMLNFKTDGTYTYKDITLRTKTKSAQDGKYTVYEHTSSNWYYLFLIPNKNSVITSYLFEKEDKNSFRLINKYKYPAFSSSFLYTRIGTNTPAVYPGMSFLGTYQYTDHTDIINGSYKNVYHYIFKEDNTLLKRHYFDVDYNKYELRSEIKGAWKINQDNFQLEIILNGKLDKYSLTSEFDAKGPSISIKNDKDSDSIHWKKIKDIAIVSTDDQFVGEYREHDGTSYISIDKRGGSYWVDIHYSFLKVENLEAHINQDGDLEMSPPNRYQNNTLLVLRAGYNRVIVVKDEASSISQMDYLEKVSKYKLPKTNATIYGGWKTRNFATDKFVDLQYYMHDGSYFETDVGGHIIYGTYTFDGAQVTTNRTCKSPSVRDVSFKGPIFKNILSYYPVIGIKSFEESGSKLESILFKHQLHVYQSKNNVKLKPHPKLNGAYVFAKEREFNDVYNYFKLKPDGTGTFFAGSSLYYEDDFTGEWNQHTNSHLFNIKYMVLFEDDKEYLVYYLSGISVNYSGYNSTTTVLNYTETIKDAKMVELFHGRTALCYKIGDQSRSKGIVLPLNVK
jgi:hypothetical protein